MRADRTMPIDSALGEPVVIDRARAMTRWMIRVLVVATGLEALRFGAGTFRVLIDLPAREWIGTAAFADLSRATDLSPAGIAFYAAFGIGGALVTAIAYAMATHTHAPRAVRWMTGTSAIASLLVLVFTTQAAPLMWRVGASPDDAMALTRLLDELTAWTVLRVICADVSFFAMLTALGYAASATTVAEGRALHA